MAKRKRGRPKGSRNKNTLMTAVDYNEMIKNGIEATASVDMKSRLDECMTRLENAVAEAITKLKEMI